MWVNNTEELFTTNIFDGGHLPQTITTKPTHPPIFQNLRAKRPQHTSSGDNYRRHSFHVALLLHLPFCLLFRINHILVPHFHRPPQDNMRPPGGPQEESQVLAPVKGPDLVAPVMDLANKVPEPSSQSYACLDVISFGHFTPPPPQALWRNRWRRTP